MNFRLEFLALAYCCLCMMPQSTFANQKEDKIRLAGFINNVWQHAPQLAQAEFEYSAVLQKVNQLKRPRFNPELSLEYTHSEVNTRTLGMSQTIDWSGKQISYAHQFDLEQERALLTIVYLRQTIALNTLKLLARYQLLQHQVQLSRTRSELLSDLVTSATQSMRAGDSHELNLAQANVAQNESLFDLTKLESELLSTETQLHNETLVDAKFWPSILSQDINPDFESVTDDNLITLSQVKLAFLNWQLAKSKINVARANTKIDPTIGMRLGTEDNKLLFAVRYEMPLLIRNNYQAAVKEANYTSLAAEKSYQHEIRKAKISFISKQKQLALLHHTYKTWNTSGFLAQQKQTKLLQHLQRTKELNASDYYQQAKQNLDVQISALELQKSVWMVFLDWLYASGQLDSWIGVNSSLSTTAIHGEQQ
ncbi:MAG: TolC family protein [Gammaproteobacteria bacterium]|nr:TolC family protein [Gammaproteobacteria bacterium]